MTKEKRSLKEAIAALPDQPRDKPAVDAATREAIARQSADRYRREIANINRTSDSEMERALRC
jgi:hypothetical protein